MKILIVFECGQSMILDCATTTMERVKYISKEHKILEVFYIK